MLHFVSADRSCVTPFKFFLHTRTCFETIYDQICSFSVLLALVAVEASIGTDVKTAMNFKDLTVDTCSQAIFNLAQANSGIATFYLLF
jgi:hypothetical protein